MPVLADASKSATPGGHDEKQALLNAQGNNVVCDPDGLIASDDKLRINRAAMAVWWQVENACSEAQR